MRKDLKICQLACKEDLDEHGLLPHWSGKSGPVPLRSARMALCGSAYPHAFGPDRQTTCPRCLQWKARYRDD